MIERVKETEIRRKKERKKERKRERQRENERKRERKIFWKHSIQLFRGCGITIWFI